MLILVVYCAAVLTSLIVFKNLLILYYTLWRILYCHNAMYRLFSCDCV